MVKKLICIALTALMLLTGCSKNEPTWVEEYDLGIRYLSESNYEKAIVAFQAAIVIDPKRPEPYIGLADVYCAMGDYNTAVSILEEAADTVSEQDIVTSKLDEVQRTYIFVGTRRVNNEDGSYTIYEYDDNGNCVLTTFHSVISEDGYFVMETFFDVALDHFVLRRQTSYDVNGNVLYLFEWNENNQITSHTSYSYDPEESTIEYYSYDGATVHVDVVYNYYYQGSKTLTASGTIEMMSEENHLSINTKGRSADSWTDLRIAEYDKDYNMVNYHQLVENTTDNGGVG